MDNTETKPKDGAACGQQLSVLLSCPFCGEESPKLEKWVEYDRSANIEQRCERITCSCGVVKHSVMSWNTRFDVLQKVIDSRSVVITSGSDPEFDDRIRVRISGNIDEMQILHDELLIR